MSEMVNILINHAQSTNTLIQFTAIDWIREFVQLSGPKMLSFASGIFTAILPCLAYEGDSRKGNALLPLHGQYLKLEWPLYLSRFPIRHQEMRTGSGQIYARAHFIARGKGECIQTFGSGFGDESAAAVSGPRFSRHKSCRTQVDSSFVHASWRWGKYWLFDRDNFVDWFGDFQMSSHATRLYPVLFETLSDFSDDVVVQGLTVLAEIVNSTSTKGMRATITRNPALINTIRFLTSGQHASQTQYRNFLVSLLKLFEEKRSLLENRGAFIISRLCALLDAETIYRILAEIIFEETANLKFASTMVRTLNTILLTTSELFDLRMLLKDISNEVYALNAPPFCIFFSFISLFFFLQKSATLFKCLYRSWAHCPISTLSLCLLAQCYQHVSELVILL